MFEKGEYVVYGSGEVCRVEEKTTRCFDGVNKTEYYKLAPVEYKNSAYYVPVKSADTEIRRLLTKDEIYRIIDGIPRAEKVWYNDKTERKSCFDSIIKSDDFMGLIGIIKSLYEERRKRTESGKRLIADDEKAFNAAEHILHGEFAFVLGIKENEVSAFIKNRLSSMNNCSI